MILDAIKTIELLKASKNVIILTHTNPDADAIGSSTALAYYLLNSCTKVQILISGEYPSNLNFLNHDNLVSSFNPEYHNHLFQECDLICALDFNDPTRIKEIMNLMIESKANKLIIDHHIKPKEFTDFQFIDTNACSTGELIWRIFRSDTNFNLDSKIATALYAAIMTDTGSFRFPKTTSEVHRIVANLIDAGADPVYVYDCVYNQFPLSATKLKGIGYSKLEQYFDNKVCIMTLSKSDFQTASAVEEETEGFVESLMAIKDVKVGILIIESPDSNQIRCSFRAKGDFEVRTLAEKFNGGGHYQAAGARVFDMSLESVKQAIIYEAGLLFS